MGGDDFHIEFEIFGESFFFILFNYFLFFKCYYSSVNLKRQSEHSGLCPDTSSLVSVCFTLKLNFYILSLNRVERSLKVFFVKGLTENKVYPGQSIRFFVD